jgi:ribose 5-phosphate isomerase B
MAMAANKVDGVRAAPAQNDDEVKFTREHNDANVLTLGAKFADPIAIVDVFLSAECTEERHLRRVGKIRAIEGSYSK